MLQVTISLEGWAGIKMKSKPTPDHIVTQSSRGKVLVKLISLTGFPQVLQHIMTTKYVTRYVTLKFYNIYYPTNMLTIHLWHNELVCP